MALPESHYEFVQLHRRFHELSRHAGESDDVDLSQAFYVSGRLSWDDLLKGHRTVILSEAGSGKTEEIRHVALRLRAEGKAAFFLRLEHIPDDLDAAFEIGSVEEFKNWLESGNEGWLLLDSVDEARLRSPGDFELAIRKIGRRIMGAKDRVHIVLTGRTHAWRPKTDLALCERHLPFIIPTTTAEQADAEVDVTDIENALACRYALYELNGFPPWFPRLFAEHGEIVSQIILREIEFELSIEKLEEETHYILSDISWSGEWAWNRLGRSTCFG